ncbi:hypothetical protein [Joostella sp. CR20]
MKKLVLIMALILGAVTLQSCDHDTADKTTQLYGIEKDKIKPPGDRG